MFAPIPFGDFAKDVFLGSLFGLTTSREAEEDTYFLSWEDVPYVDPKVETVTEVKGVTCGVSKSLP